MDLKVVFTTLETVCEDIVSGMCAPSDMPYGAVANRLVTCMKEIQEHGRVLEPVVAGFVSVFHHYDFDAQTPGNGYRTLVKVRALVTGVQRMLLRVSLSVRVGRVGVFGCSDGSSSP